MMPGSKSPGSSPRPQLHDRVAVSLALAAGGTRLGTVVGRSGNPGLPFSYVEVRLDGAEETLKLLDRHLRVIAPAPGRPRLAAVDGVAVDGAAVDGVAP